MTNNSIKIKQYQAKISYKLSGVIITSVLSEILGEKPTLEQVAYLYSLLKIRTRKYKDGEEILYLQIPVQYLFCCLTPFSSDDYSKRSSKEYMSSVTKNTISPLQNIVSVTNSNEGYCRRFMISEEFLHKYTLQEESTMNIELPPIELIKPSIDVGEKPAKWGGYSLPLRKLPPVTKQAWEKLKVSKFRFDVDLFNSYKGKQFNQSLNLDPMQRTALISAMDDISWTNKPQYHDSFFIQGPGRLHTKGGPIAMTSLFRRFYIKPTNPNNVSLEIDLKCAQLLILCDILHAEEVKYQILQVLKEESIWKYIGEPSLPKSVKKVIVYGFCFGARMYELPYLATQKAKTKYHLDIAINQRMVNDCFSGILKPLVNLRDNWMKDYSIPKIVDKKLKEVVYFNSLDLPINLEEELISYRKTNRKKVNNLKIGARLLAHYAQGYEQLIIQSMISEVIKDNILTYSYDGLTLEVNPQETNLVISDINNWITTRFPDYTVESLVY